MYIEVHLNTCGGKGLQVGGDVMATDGKGWKWSDWVCQVSRKRVIWDCAEW